MSFFGAFLEGCCGGSTREEGANMTSPPPLRNPDGTRWISDISPSSNDERGDDVRMEIRVICAKRLRAGFYNVHFTQPWCSVTLSDGKTDGRELLRTPVATTGATEEAGDKWDYSAVIKLDRIDLLRPTTILRFEISDFVDNEMYVIREFSGADLRQLVNKNGTIKKALKLPGGESIPKRDGKAPSLHVGVQVTPNPYTVQRAAVSSSSLSPLSRSPSTLKNSLSRRSSDRKGITTGSPRMTDRTREISQIRIQANSKSAAHTTAASPSSASSAPASSAPANPAPANPAPANPAPANSSTSVAPPSPPPAVADVSEDVLTDMSLTVPSSPEQRSSRKFLNTSDSTISMTDSTYSSNGGSAAVRSPVITHRISEHKSNSSAAGAAASSGEIAWKGLLASTTSGTKIEEKGNVAAMVVIKEKDKEKDKEKEKEKKNTMDAPIGSPAQSVHSKTHNNIVRTLSSSFALSREVDQALRTLSGDDKRGKVQTAFLMSATKQAVAPDAARLFYKNGILTKSFSRYFTLAMSYYDTCEEAVLQNQHVSKFSEMEHYDKFLVALRSCQLLLFKSEGNSSVQEQVLEDVRKDLESFHEVLRVYALLMTRRVQIAMWEQQFGLSSHLLRRLWLDVCHIRKVLIETHNDEEGVTIANEVEQYLEEKSLECGRNLSLAERAQLQVSMPDYHGHKHVSEETSVMHKKNLETTRNELFEHCEEFIFELPAKEPWGITMKCHDPGNILRIKSVRKGKPGQLAGLKVGDYIDEIGGDPLHEGGEELAVNCIKKHKREEDNFVEIVIMREHQNEEERNAALSEKLRKLNRNAAKTGRKKSQSSAAYNRSSTSAF